MVAHIRDVHKEMATHSSTLAWKIPWTEVSKSRTRLSDFTTIRDKGHEYTKATWKETSPGDGM